MYFISDIGRVQNLLNAELQANRKAGVGVTEITEVIKLQEPTLLNTKDVKSQSQLRQTQGNQSNQIIEAKPQENPTEAKEQFDAKVVYRTRCNFNNLFGEAQQANLTGLWTRGEHTRYVLFESFNNGKVIGFMQYKGTTVSTLLGERYSGNTFKIFEKGRTTNERRHYEVVLYPNEKRVELKNNSSSGGAIDWTLHLSEKRLPYALFRELQDLKKVENFDDPYTNTRRGGDQRGTSRDRQWRQRDGQRSGYRDQHRGGPKKSNFSNPLHRGPPGSNRHRDSKWGPNRRSPRERRWGPRH